MCDRVAIIHKGGSSRRSVRELISSRREMELRVDDVARAAGSRRACHSIETTASGADRRGSAAARRRARRGRHRVSRARERRRSKRCSSNHRRRDGGLMMIPLIQNETLKIIRRKRFAIVIGILAAIIGIVSYGQYRHLQEPAAPQLARGDPAARRRLQEHAAPRAGRRAVGAVDARGDQPAAVLSRSRHRAEQADRAAVRAHASRTSPASCSSRCSSRVLGSDIVSAENAEGTDKLLLTRPVRRWKVLTSKLITLWIFATLTLLVRRAARVSSSPSPFLPRGGWTAPTFTGFQHRRSTRAARRRAPAAALEGRADRVRTGVVRAADRRLRSRCCSRCSSDRARPRSGRCSRR